MSLLCRASSTVAAIPFRAVRSRVSLQTDVQRVTTLCGSHQFSRASSLISFSTLTAITADENLVSVLESEIQSAVEAPVDLPEGFPFHIVDTPRERDVYLRRKFEDETVVVQIDLSPPQDGEEEQVLTGIPMVLNASKDDDDGFCLEFVLKAYVDKIVIDAVYVQQPHEPTYLIRTKNYIE